VTFKIKEYIATCPQKWNYTYWTITCVL